MKNFKITTTHAVCLICILLSTVAAVAASFFQTENSSGKQIKDAIPAIKESDVAQIEIKTGSLSPVALVRSDSGWLVRQNGYPDVFADPAKVAAILNDIVRSKPLREIELEGDLAAQLSLDDFDPENPYLPPEPGATAVTPRFGYRITLKNDIGSQLLAITLGQAHYRTLEGGQIVPDSRYIRVDYPDGSKRIFLVSRLFEYCQPFAHAWMDHPRWGTEALPVLIQAKGAGALFWEYRAGSNTFVFPAKSKISYEKMEKQRELLMRGFTRNIAPLNSEKDFIPDFVYSIESGDGSIFRLEAMMDENEMKRYGRVNYIFDASGMRALPGENETAKQQRIAGMEAGIKKLQDRYGNKIYILQPNVISILKAIPGK